MELILTIAVWAGLFYLMMRLGCGSHIMGSSNKNGQLQTPRADANTPELAWTPAEKTTDPVCQKTITTRLAKTCVHAGKAYYFCSRDCREIFEAAPELYIATRDTTQKQTEHAHV